MRKISNALVTLSSAAILAVYAAGYERTSPAADRFAAQTAQRRAAVAQTAKLPGAEAAPTSPISPASRSVASVPPAATVSSLPSSTSTPAEVPNAAPVSVPTESSVQLASAPPEALPATEPVTPAAGEQRAAEPSAPTAPPPAAQSLYKDGTYLGWGSSRHGDIQASVVIQDGRIASAEISQCLTRYPCSWIAQLPGQVVGRQKASVDYISGATQSVNAYYDAIVEALDKAK